MSNENKLLGKQLKNLRQYFNSVPTEVLMLALQGGVDLNQLAHEALANRGWSAERNYQVGVKRDTKKAVVITTTAYAGRLSTQRVSDIHPL